MVILFSPFFYNLLLINPVILYPPNPLIAGAYDARDVGASNNGFMVIAFLFLNEFH